MLEAKEELMSAVLPLPPAKTVTPDDLLLMPDQGQGFELVDGELRERKMSTLAHLVAGEVYYHLRTHVGPNRLGWVFSEGTSFRCFPDDEDRVRRADCAFTRLDRHTPAQAESEGHCTVVPDLVVEVVSPKDLIYEVEDKRDEWLEAGAQLVWIVNPVRQTIHAYRPDGSGVVFRPTDTLTAEPVLPDFRVPVTELFQLPTAA
jgi:Uma2 family endonuclease